MEKKSFKGKSKRMQTLLRLYASVLMIMCLHHVHSIYAPSAAGTCKDMVPSMCDSMPYNRSFMPNRLGHAEPEDAVLEVHQFFPFVEAGCSPATLPFLCVIYFPPCSPRGGGLEPCAQLCRMAKDGCAPLLERYGYVWPSSLDCDNFRQSYRCFDADWL